MFNSGNQRKIAVVGAGLGGLITAYKLAESGTRVTVFEKDHQSGGRAKTSSKDGFKLNLGPHALYLGGSTYRFLSGIGLKPMGAPPTPNKPLAVYEGQLHGLPFTAKDLLLTGYLSVLEKLELASFMTKLPKLDVSELMSVSLSDWLHRNLKGVRARQTIECFVRLSTYCDAPGEIAAGAALEQLQLASQGVLYLDNGWATIVSSLETALADRFESHVEIRHGAQIDAIHETETGTELVVGEEQTNFDATILCVPPTEAMRLAPKLRENKTLESLTPNQSACLDICLRKLPNLRRTFVLGVDEPLYFSVHSNAAKLAPDGRVVLHAAYYFRTGTAHKEYESRLEKLLDQVQTGWRNEVVFKRYLPHMVVSYGTPAATRDGNSGLASPLAPGYSKIFLCGDYVGSGGQLVDCSTSSALQAAAAASSNKAPC
ncbi:MAG TPA: FAD-dependent oxidoreductase [Oculatellaceae cyanobacterium]